MDARQQHNEDSVWAYWRILVKRRLLIGATLVAVMAAFVAFNMWKPRIYEATATVIIDPIAPKLLPGSQDVVELGSGTNWYTQEYYNTQIRILKSRALAQAVARVTPSLLNDKRFGAGRLTQEEIEDKATDYVQNRVRVLPIRDSRVFAISFADHDPKLAALLADAVAAAYIEQNRAVKLDATHDASRWVAQQLDDARRALDKSETALYEFKRDNNILSVNLEERQNLISKSLDDYSGALTAARRQRIDLESRLKAISEIMASDPANVPSSYITQQEHINTLRNTYLEERRKQQYLVDRYGEKWPELVAQSARTEQTLADLRSEGQRMVRSLQAEIRALRDAENRYDAEVNGLTTEALELNKKEIVYKRLSRDAVNSDQIYAQLLKRLNESDLQEQDRSNNIRPLDAARIPTVPTEPRLKQAVVFGFAAGLLIALVLAFAIEMFDRTVKSQEEIEHVMGLPFLGLVPAVEGDSDKPELHVMTHPASMVAEFCRVVRTNILFCSPDEPLKTLLVTSAGPVEGKTMTAVNLGVVMAQSGQRTLLVDTDMRRPRLHKVLGVSNEHGVSRLILGDGTIDDAVKSTAAPNLYVLPCGPLPPNPAEILQTERFAALAAKLAERFDRVIFDSPPILGVTDAVVLSRVTSGVVLVARAGRTTRDALLRARSHLKGVNARLLGVVLNAVNPKGPHYAAYYGYASRYYVKPQGEAAARAGEG